MLNQIILGVIQGVFEWIPVSSEGILALAGQLMIKDFNIIDIALFLHLGTLFAVLIYFKEDWKKILTLKDIVLLRFLTISTIVSLIVAFPIYGLIRNVVIGGGLLMIMGFALLLTAYFYKKGKRLRVGPDKLALITGFFQGLSVIPGLSRSGATIFGLSLSKDDPSEILKTSYLMSVHVVLASSCYILLKNPLIINNWPSLVFSFLIGLTSLHFLLTISKRVNLFKFIIFFGLACLLGGLIELI